MVPQDRSPDTPPTETAEGRGLRLRAAAIELLEATRISFANAEADREETRIRAERGLARMARTALDDGMFSERELAERLGIDRTRLRRILRDYPAETDDPLTWRLTPRELADGSPASAAVKAAREAQARRQQAS